MHTILNSQFFSIKEASGELCCRWSSGLIRIGGGMLTDIHVDLFHHLLYSYLYFWWVFENFYAVSSVSSKYILLYSKY